MELQIIEYQQSIDEKMLNTEKVVFMKELVNRLSSICSLTLI